MELTKEHLRDRGVPLIRRAEHLDLVSAADQEWLEEHRPILRAVANFLDAEAAWLRRLADRARRAAT